MITTTWNYAVKMATRGWLLTIHSNRDQRIAHSSGGQPRKQAGLLPPPDGRHSHAGALVCSGLNPASISYCLSGDLHRLQFCYSMPSSIASGSTRTAFTAGLLFTMHPLPLDGCEHGWLAMDRCWSRSGRFLRYVAVASLHRGESLHRARLLTGPSFFATGWQCYAGKAA